MFGNNQQLGVVEKDCVDVCGVWSTLQGEGPYSGRRATFVRLAGCNLSCWFCDTDFSVERSKPYSVEQLVDAVLSHPAELVVFTGGEPFRQPRMTSVVEALVGERLVQIETSGSLCMTGLPDDCVVVVSPKTPKVHHSAVFADAWKYVLRAGEVAKDGLPSRSAMKPSVAPARPSNLSPVYVQPLDEGEPELNNRNMKAAVESCLAHGYLLSVQLHKIVGVP